MHEVVNGSIVPYWAASPLLGRHGVAARLRGGQRDGAPDGEWRSYLLAIVSGAAAITALLCLQDDGRSVGSEAGIIAWRSRLYRAGHFPAPDAVEVAGLPL